MKRSSLLITLALLGCSSAVAAQTDITNQMPRVENGKMVNSLPAPQPPPQPQIPSVNVGPMKLSPGTVSPPAQHNVKPPDSVPAIKGEATF